MEVLNSITIDKTSVLTDPPYQIGKAWKRTYYGSNGKSRLWGKEQKWDNLHPLVAELPNLYEIVIIWGGNFYPLPPSRCWFVWDKLQKSFGADCELAWVKADVAPKVFRMSRIDAYVNKADGPKIHPNQKPTLLMEWCIRMAKIPTTNTILDPFAGSASTGAACFKTGNSFIGIEQDETYCESAAKRLETISSPADQ